MRIYVCQSCKAKNKIGGRIKGRTCKECGYPLDAPYIPPSPPIEPKPKKTKVNKEIHKEFQKEVIIQTKEVKVKVEGEFKQYGVLCLNCKTITQFGNKRCQNCRNKLKITPKTTVYYNGAKEALQCPKCGKYSEFKGLKCEHCNKKFKF